MRKRAYRSVSVKSVIVSEINSHLSEGPVTVGLDIGKETIFAVVRDQTGYFERPWKVQNPSEIEQLIQHAKQLSIHHPLTIVMESTGTYGDAVRQAVTDAGLEMCRVGSKASSDYKEIFDGVPSGHDGKDAAVPTNLGVRPGLRFISGVLAEFDLCFAPLL